MAETDAYGNDAYIVDPTTGQTFRVPKSSLVSELEAGAELATPEQIVAFREEDAKIRKFSTPVQQVVTGLESAASALTFGGSTMVERALGVDPADIRARQEVNPGIDITGNVIGIAGPALVTGGGTAAAQGAVKGGLRAGVSGALRASPAGLVMQAGERAGAGVAKALGDEVATSLVGGIARKAAPMAVQGAVEGAALQTGALLEEIALGDPKFNGEAALSSVGLSALLGGALGGAFGGAGEALVRGARGARNAGEKAFATTLEKYPKFAAAMGYDEGLVTYLGQNRLRLAEEGGLTKVVDEYLAATGKSPRIPDAPTAPREPIPGAFEPEPLPRAPKEIAEDSRRVVEGVESLDKATDDAVNLYFGEVRPQERLDATTILAIDDAVAQKEARRVLTKVDETIKAFKARPKLYPAAYSEKLKEIQSIARSVDRADATPEQLFGALDDLKRELDPLAKFGLSPTLEQQAAVSAIRDLRAEVKGSLENPEVWNQLAVRQKAINAAYTERNAARKDVRRLLYTKKALASGGVEYIPSPEKFERFLGSLGKPSNSAKEAAFARYYQATRALHDEIAVSARVLPGRYDRAAVENIIATTKANVDAARATAQAQAAYPAALEATKAANRLGKKQALDARKLAVETNKLAKEADKAARVQVKEARKARDAEVAGIAKSLQGQDALGIKDVLGVDIALRSPLVAVPYAAYKIKQFLASPAKVYASLNAVEKMAQTAKKAIDSAASTLVRGGVKAAKVTRVEAVAGLSSVLAKSQKSLQAQFAEDSENLSKMADPAYAAEHFWRTVGGDLDALPETSVAMQAGAYRAAMYLYEKMPKAPARGMLGAAWVPNRVQLTEFYQVKAVLDRPADTFLKFAAAGTLTKPQVEAVRTCYPELFREFQGALIRQLAAHPDSTPLRQKMAISLILGEPVQPILGAEATLKNQSALASTFGQQEMPAPPVGNPSAGSISVAGRTATPAQRNEAPGE